MLATPIIIYRTGHELFCQCSAVPFAQKSIRAPGAPVSMIKSFSHVEVMNLLVFSSEILTDGPH